MAIMEPMDLGKTKQCIDCREVSLSHGFPSSGMPCLDLLGHRAMTPAKLKLSPSDWYLHVQRRTPTSVHREAVPSLEEVFYGGLDSFILGHYSKNKLAHNLQLLTNQKTLCLL